MSDNTDAMFPAKQLSRYIASLIIAMTQAVMPVAALADSFADRSVINTIHAGWGRAENAPIEVGHYANAVATLQTTKPFLASIQGKFIRKCVADGANMYIASATAGKMFLAMHPGDLAGGKTAARRAQLAFPSRADCP